MRSERAVAFLLVLVACGLPSVDDYARGTPDGGGSSSGSSSSSGNSSSSSSSGTVEPSDGGVDAASSDGGGTPGPNILKNPDFEDGTCGDANFYRGQGGVTSTAHTGMFACQACRQDESTDIYTWNTPYVVESPAVGDTYRASAWVKRGADSFKDQKVAITIRTAQMTPFATIEQAASDEVALTDEWTRLETTLTVTKMAPVLDVYVGVTTQTTAGQRCFIVDDVSLTRQ